MTDVFRLVGAVNAEQRVLAILMQIERAGTERIVRTTLDLFWQPLDAPIYSGWLVP